MAFLLTVQRCRAIIVTIINLQLMRYKNGTEEYTMKDLGAKAFSYGYASPVLMAATYNDDGTVNVMNLHEVTRTNAGDPGVLYRQA